MSKSLEQCNIILERMESNLVKARQDYDKATESNNVIAEMRLVAEISRLTSEIESLNNFKKLITEEKPQ